VDFKKTLTVSHDKLWVIIMDMGYSSALDQLPGQTVPETAH